mgnify:CR=1 FL=1
MEITAKTQTDDLLVVKNLSKKFLLKKHKLPWHSKTYVHVINGCLLYTSDAADED